MTVNKPITDLLSAPLGPDWTVEALAERLLDAIAAHRSEEAQVFVFDADATTDRQSRRLLRPLLACLATKSAAEAGTPANLYSGHFSFKRPGPKGPVWILGQFENRPGSVRVSLRRSSSPPELPEARPGQPAAITDAAGPTRDKAQEEANQTKEDRETIFTGALAAYRAGKTESLRTILEVGYEFLQSRRGLWLREGKGLGQVEEEDVILDVIASLPRYIDHFAVVDLISFQRWLAVVMRHRVIDLVRKEVRHKHELLKDVAEAETPSPAESLESQEAVERLLAAVGDLPSDYRSILVLRLSGMSLSEISELLGISVSATARRFHRLIHQLRDQLPTKRGE